MLVTSNTSKNNQYNAGVQFSSLTNANKLSKASSGQNILNANNTSTLGQLVASKNQEASYVKQAAVWIDKTDKNILTYFKNNAEKAEKNDTPQLSNIKVSDLQSVANAFQIISDQNASNSQKSSAVTNLFSTLKQQDFAGTVNNPDKIQGQKVVGSSMTSDGKPAYLLENGKTVDKDSLVTARNLQVALNTINIVNGDKSDADKLIGVAGNTVVLANVNDLISDESAGYLTAGIEVASLISKWGDLNSKERITKVTDIAPSLIQSAENLGYISGKTAGGLGAIATIGNAAANWENMNDTQRTNALLQGGSTFISALDDAGYSALGSSAASTIGGLAGVAGVVTGTMDAVDVFTAISDMPRSEGRRYGAIGAGSAGATIGAGVGGVMAASAATAAGAYAGAQAGTMVFPVVGTVIGAAIGMAAGYLAGSFGSGKSPGQMMRDQWRDNMEKGGFAVKSEGSHYVPLADGSAYNIGFDGNHKLANADGTQRHTFDVDWGNELAVNSVPFAHIFSLATGLDPSIEKGALWHRGVAQSLNAATSNATSQEDVTDNFRAMLMQGKADPVDLALKVEVLRQENKIGEQEYSVYLGKINELFGTSIAPTDKATALVALQSYGYGAPQEKKK